MFVDRGDPAAWDFEKAALTTDGTWRTLDLSGIVPSTAKAIILMGHLMGNGVDWKIRFRTKGNSNEINHAGLETLRANVNRHRTAIVALCGSREIEYNADNQAWTTLNLSVRGWWTD